MVSHRCIQADSTYYRLERQQATAQLPDHWSVESRLLQSLAVIQRILRLLERGPSMAGYRIHFHVGASALGEPQEHQRMGEDQSQRRNRSGTLCKLCRQGLSCNAYHSSKMDILIRLTTYEHA